MSIGGGEAGSADATSEAIASLLGQHKSIAVWSTEGDPVAMMSPATARTASSSSTTNLVCPRYFKAARQILVSHKPPWLREAAVFVGEGVVFRNLDNSISALYIPNWSNHCE